MSDYTQQAIDKIKSTAGLIPSNMDKIKELLQQQKMGVNMSFVDEITTHILHEMASAVHDVQGASLSKGEYYGLYKICDMGIYGHITSLHRQERIEHYEKILGTAYNGALELHRATKALGLERHRDYKTGAIKKITAAQNFVLQLQQQADRPYKERLSYIANSIYESLQFVNDPKVHVSKEEFLHLSTASSAILHWIRPGYFHRLLHKPLPHMEKRIEYAYKEAQRLHHFAVAIQRAA